MNQLICCLLIAFVLVLPGCKKNPAAATASPEQIVPAVQKAFGDANSEVKTLASDLAGSVQNKDYPKAFMQAQELGEHAGLTADQRQTAAQAQMMAMQQLNSAAANGDQQAADFLKAYKATK